jgi:hypothetical protein
VGWRWGLKKSSAVIDLEKIHHKGHKEEKKRGKVEEQSIVGWG